MKMTKKKVGLGVAIIIALGVLGWVFKPAPAEAADVSVYGNLNYMVSNNDDANGKESDCRSNERRRCLARDNPERNSNNDEVIGPDQTKDKARRLP